VSANPVSKTRIDALVYAYFTWVEDAVNVPCISPERAAKRRSLWSEANKIRQNLPAAEHPTDHRRLGGGG